PPRAPRCTCTTPTPRSTRWVRLSATCAASSASNPAHRGPVTNVQGRPRPALRVGQWRGAAAARRHEPGTAGHAGGGAAQVGPALRGAALCARRGLLQWGALGGAAAATLALLVPIWHWGSLASDVFDSLQVAARALVHGHNPYAPTTWVAMPSTPGHFSLAY